MCHSAFDLVAIRDQWGSCRDEAYLAVLDVFIAEADVLCSKLHLARSPLQRNAIGAAAHTLRGAASNVGAVQLAACAAVLESSAANASPQEVNTLLTDLNSAWQDVKNALSNPDRDV